MAHNWRLSKEFHLQEGHLAAYPSLIEFCATTFVLQHIWIPTKVNDNHLRLRPAFLRSDSHSQITRIVGSTSRLTSQLFRYCSLVGNAPRNDSTS